MNVLFVTIGTSAIENPNIGKAPDERDNTALRADVKRYLEDPRKEGPRWQKLRRDLASAHLRYWSGMNDSYTMSRFNFSKSCAELTSTFCLIRELDFEIDRIVLLPTDTAEGRFACDVVWEVMKSRDYAIGVETDQIVVEPIPGLDIKDGTINELKSVVAKHTKSVKDRRVVNVTGGFKGTALLFGRLAADVNYHFYYQHGSQASPVWMRDLKAPSIE